MKSFKLILKNPRKKFGLIMLILAASIYYCAETFWFGGNVPMSYVESIVDGICIMLVTYGLWFTYDASFFEKYNNVK